MRSPLPPSLLPLALATAALLAGCATQPTPLQGEYRDISPRDAVDHDSTGALVRWGGRIVQVEPRQDSTCFEVVSARLDASGRPLRGDGNTGGRFIACRSGFYDPAVFERNREITFTGRLAGYDNRRIGEYGYRFPKVDADIVYLWSQRDTVHVVTRPAPWPWWGWW